MSAIELSAKSLEEAKKSAAEKLGVSVDQVEVKVLEEVKGLFGKTSLRVSAHVIASAPVEVPVVAEAAPIKAAVETAPVEAEAAPKATKGGRGRGKKAPAEEVATEAPAEGATSEEGGESEAEIVATDEDAANVLGLVHSFLEASDLEVTAVVGSVQGRYVNVTIDGKDASYLVGKHGEVINALQYLVNIVSNRRFRNGIRATIECNDYRRKREEQLIGLAKQISAQVIERNEECVLDALPAFERRIVHRALQEIEGVSTYSEGEEPNRRVVIAPAE